MILLLIFQLWASHISAHDRAVGRFSELRLWGTWQSCTDDKGEYGEVSFSQVVGGRVLWTLHLGPFDEFALYRGSGPTDGPHSHNPPDNLVGSAFHYYAFPSRTGQNWSIPSLKLKVNVISVPTSREECEGFEVKVEETK